MINDKYTGYNSTLKTNARELRKSMTRQEKRLWYDFLKGRPEKWYKQRVIDNYIADFYCSKYKLVIELDGSQHYKEEAKEYDSDRTEKMKKYGIEVLRFYNHDIDTNFIGVCKMIRSKVEALNSLP